jgi:hypothetical protein
MIGIPKLEYSPHQAPALEALSPRLQEKLVPNKNTPPEAELQNLSEDNQAQSQTPENNLQQDVLYANLSDDDTDQWELGGSVCFAGDSE